MPVVVHRFDEPERFVAGTVGEPGQRTFFLQARDGARVTSVALEKQQVSVLAERVEMLLDEALRRSGGDAAIPAVAPTDSRDGDPLEQPIVEEFRVGTITLSWDADAGLVVIELYPVSDEAVVEFEDDSDDEDEENGEDGGERPELDLEIEANEVLVVTMRPSYARSFVQRAISVVAAGRPPCPFCGNPLDPEGHLCPRANGYRRLAG
jgi:uncharacterized repeat protein (TIGR03847 family)